MQSSFLNEVLLPVALAIIMLGMGLSLTTADFKRAFAQPKALLAGLFGQMLVLPLLGFAVVSLFSLRPEVAVGLMILTFCPGGTTSNIITYLARGDLAVSVSLTAFVSLITPLTIPLFAALATSHFMGDSAEFSMPILQTIGALVLITLVPVAIGMAIRARAPSFAERSERMVKLVSVVFLFAIIAAILIRNKAQLGNLFAEAGVPALVLNLTAMAAGYLLARAATLGRSQTTAITIEVGIQNGTTALLITATLIGNNLMTIGPAVYSLVMFATGGVFALFAGRAADARERAGVA